LGPHGLGPGFSSPLKGGPLGGFVARPLGRIPSKGPGFGLKVGKRGGKRGGFYRGGPYFFLKRVVQGGIKESNTSGSVWDNF